MPEFIQVAKKSDLPSDTGYLVDVQGEQIALFKAGDQVYAVSNICPHQGGPMAEGSLNDKTAMCPWHGWEFDVQTGVCVFNDSVKIPTYEIKEEDGNIFVKIPG